MHQLDKTIKEAYLLIKIILLIKKHRVGEDYLLIPIIMNYCI